jgi:ubiquinone/menaquinone biosynthesis C-methylase UbiE
MQAAVVGSVNQMNNRLFNASMAKRLDDPERLLWLPPAMVIGALAVQHGDSIVDIGAGTGYFSLPLVQAAGPLGQVYAVDSQIEMLEHLQHKLDTENISNIRVVRAEADSTGLPAASCNLILLANVWHEITDRAAVLIEAKRILKSRGKIAILDWRTDVEPKPGPPLDHRLSAADAAGDLRSAGFAEVKQSNVAKYSWLVQGIMHSEVDQ